MGASKSKEGEEKGEEEEEKKEEKKIVKDRGSEGILEKLPSLPLDGEGFALSFSLDEKEELLNFFHEFGVVVIRDVISQEAIDRTIEEIWDELFKMSLENVVRDDPSTWSKFWPTGKIGILGLSVASGKEAWNNRQNPNIKKAFEYIFGEEDSREGLLSSVDRYGILKPTIGVPIAKDSKETKDHPEWRGPDSWLHWDLNPWAWCGVGSNHYPFKHPSWDTGTDQNFISEMNGMPPDLCKTKLQGIVVLADSRENDGGFLCVPGFHKHLEDWAKQNSQTRTPSSVDVPKKDKMKTKAVPICARKGSLIIWTSQLPHCNFPNKSENFRFCQYLKMFPAHTVPNKEGRAQAIQHRIPKDFVVDEIGRETLGLKYLEEE